GGAGLNVVLAVKVASAPAKASVFGEGGFASPRARHARRQSIAAAVLAGRSTYTAVAWIWTSGTARSASTVRWAGVPKTRFAKIAIAGSDANATRFAHSMRPVTRQTTPWSSSAASGNPW